MKIGIDVDDTLLDFVGAYIIFHNKIYKTNLKKEDFKTYSFNHVMGGTMGKAINSVKEFYTTPFFMKMIPLQNAIDVVQKLKKYNELFVITSRSSDMQEGTLEQITRYFPNTFSRIIFASNHYTKIKNTGKTKAEICLDLGASLLIDDSLIYTKECVIEGINAILIDAPWNQDGDIRGVTRVKNWREILEVLK